jgi:hypothetical protein
MLNQIPRQEAIAKFQNFPLRHYDYEEDDYIFNYPKVYASIILTLNSKSYKGHIKLLSTEIISLAKNLGFDNFTFLGDEDIPWLKRLKTYENFQESLQYFVDNKVKKRFNGALQVGITEIPIFIKHLAWLVRTNGIMPYVFFIDPGQTIIGDICQYGNLHISALNRTAHRNLKNAIAKTQFVYLPDEHCYNKFSKSGAIKSRTITT